jgi:hypothetical protein
MAAIRVLDSFAWPRSTATRLLLEELVNSEQLTLAGDGPHPAWMVPPASDREPNPPLGYVVSFIRLHEHDFNAPRASLCGGCATTTGWSFTTSPPTPSRRRPPSSLSVRDSWGSR